MPDKNWEELQKETKELIEKAKQIISDRPDNNPDSSLDFYREDPESWIVSKGRALRIALNQGDEDMINEVVTDYAHVFGFAQANQWKHDIWGKMISEGLEDTDPDIDE